MKFRTTVYAIELPAKAADAWLEAHPPPDHAIATIGFPGIVRIGDTVHVVTAFDSPDLDSIDSATTWRPAELGPQYTVIGVDVKVIRR